MANVMITGLFPFCRCVFITDGVLANFSAEEIESLLAHEIGHIKKMHLWGYFLFSICYAFGFVPLLVYLVGKFPAIEDFLMENKLASPLWVLAIIMVYFGAIFGLLSRKFEKQADKYAVELTGNKDVFISALRKLAKINALPKKWAKTEVSQTHPATEERIRFIKAIPWNIAV